MKKNTNKRKSQLSPFYLTIIATVLILTMVTVNIGKIAKDKTYTANSADGGAISAASVMAFAFNYVANANKSSGDDKLHANWDRFKNELDKYVNNTQNLYDQYVVLSNATQAMTCCETICGAEAEAQKAIEKIGKKAGSGKGTGFIGQVNELIKGAWPAADSNEKKQLENDIGLIPNYAQLQESFYIAIRERVHDDSKNGNDLYQIALSAGCKYNMFNSGFPTKMGEDSKMFFEFVDQECSPDTIENGQAVTFTWTDKAGRSHTVSAITSIDAVHDYELYEAEATRSNVKQMLDESMQEATDAIADIETAKEWYNAACDCTACLPCDIWCICIPDCFGLDEEGDASMRDADTHMSNAMNLVRMTQQGIEQQRTNSSGKKTDTNGDIIWYIKDITHNRQVTSENFQKHQGGVIKSPRETPDTPTFYPPVQSSATASFAGNGNIENGEASHDSSLGQ
jgi:hypothetical protein